jgi:hypothetical protein
VRLGKAIQLFQRAVRRRLRDYTGGFKTWLLDQVNDNATTTISANGRSATSGGARSTYSESSSRSANVGCTRSKPKPTALWVNIPDSLDRVAGRDRAPAPRRVSGSQPVPESREASRSADDHRCRLQAARKLSPAETAAPTDDERLEDAAAEGTNEQSGWSRGKRLRSLRSGGRRAVLPSHVGSSSLAKVCGTTPWGAGWKERDRANSLCSTRRGASHVPHPDPREAVDDEDRRR